MARPALEIRMQNVPIINLRWEFRDQRRMVDAPDFGTQFEGVVKPFETPCFTWLGMPAAGMTLLIQRAILGLESYICGAVYERLARVGTLEKHSGMVRNPFKLGGSGTADNYYNRLPGLVDASFSLQIVSPDLWVDTNTFYRTVRNRLFHGEELADPCPDGVKDAFDLMADVYSWIDSWCPPDEFLPGFGTSFE